LQNKTQFSFRIGALQACLIRPIYEQGKAFSMADENKSFQDGFTQNTYTGDGSDFAAWSRGNMMRQEEERRRRTATQQVLGEQKPSPQNQQAPAPYKPMTTAEAFALPVFILLLGAIVLLPFIVAGAFLAVPVLRRAERIWGKEDETDFADAYKLMFKALFAYAGTTVILFSLFALLGNYFAPGLLGAYTTVFGGFINSFNNAHAFAHISFSQITGTLALLLPPSLAAFAFMMRHENKELFSGARGFRRGMATGLAVLPAAFLGAAAVLWLLNAIF
jgi:hypothetical protein